MEKIRSLKAIKYGETFIDEGMAYRGGDRSVKLPISLIIYLIDTGERKILVDAGCENMPGFELSHFSSPAETLIKAGVSPEDITDVILTHAHHDHAQALFRFANSTVHVESREVIQAKRYIPTEMKTDIFTDGTIIDGCVRAVRIGGHSHGSSIVELEYKGKTHVICGDECYVRRCLDECIPTGSSVSPESSLEFVRKYGSDKYVTHLCHDVEILKGQTGVLEI